MKIDFNLSNHALNLFLNTNSVCPFFKFNLMVQNYSQEVVKDN